MKELPELADCKTKDEMLKQCDIACKALHEFIDEVPEGYLLAKADPSGWNTKTNVTHGAVTLSIIANWIKAPGFILKLRGKPKVKSLAMADMVVTNRPKHYDYGSYPVPGKKKPQLRPKLKAKVTKACEKWKKAVNQRTEEELDSYSGLFGGTTLRLFAMFSLKHMIFHAGVARLRIENGTSPDYTPLSKQSAK